MAVADNPYSKFVFWAKIIFPLLALAFLSTLFLFSRTLDPTAAIPFSEIDVEKIAREQRLTGPRLTSVTSDGSSIMVSADSAAPDLTDRRKLSIERAEASIVTVDGTSYKIEAANAFYDGNINRLDLVDGVRMATSNGYSIETQTIYAHLDTTGLEAPGRITGQAPAGRFEAGSMFLGVRDGEQLLVFKGGVKLVYDPQE